MFAFAFAALLAVTVSRVQKPRVPGSQRRTVTDVTCDNSYAEGGEKVTPADLGLEHVDHAHCAVIHGTESSEQRVTFAHYDQATELLHLFDAATGKELAKEKDASKVKVRVTAYGY